MEMPTLALLCRDASTVHSLTPSLHQTPVTCLVVDAVMSFGFDAGREIGVPVLAISAKRGLVPFKHDCTSLGGKRVF
jgi:hypothetical protein